MQVKSGLPDPVVDMFYHVTLVKEDVSILIFHVNSFTTGYS